MMRPHVNIPRCDVFIEMCDSWSVSRKIIELPIKNIWWFYIIYSDAKGVISKKHSLQIFTMFVRCLWIIQFFIYICMVLRRYSAFGKRIRGGADIWKGVYYALVLATWNPEKISKVQVKNKVAVDAPWLYYLYSPHCVTAIGVSLHQWQL